MELHSSLLGSKRINTENEYILPKLKRKKLNTNDFIEKAILIHGCRYDYSKVTYMKGSVKVLIHCREHGDFFQQPSAHLYQRQGCPTCYGNTVSTNEKFIQKAISIHGHKYDYSKVNYINNHTNVTIHCKKHGDFTQQPSVHIGTRASGCKICSGKIVHTTEQFIEYAKRIHNNKYDYSKVNYINSSTKVTIICPYHQEFQQSPQVHIGKKKCGCKKCSSKIHAYNRSKCTVDFIKEATEIHGNKYEYSKTNYTNNNNKVRIICPQHGEFEQSPSHHVSNQSGCPDCCGKKLSTTNEFISKARLIHGTKYNYSKVIYQNCKKKVLIICPYQHEFLQSPNWHLYGGGCPKCSKQYSQLCINWLDFISKMYHINIQHALNGNEYIIPTTKFKADGYCRETNTIYEFHGDYWHGNPKIHSFSDTTHFHKTFGELYEKTLERENKIKLLGYNLVTMWESNWKQLNKAVKKLQMKYRNNVLT
jgi:hypothetical protein